MSDHTDRRTLYEAYYVNRRTTKDIAAQYHVHHTTITYWLRKHRIKRPPPLPKGKPRACCYCGTSFLALPGSNTAPRTVSSTTRTASPPPNDTACAVSTSCVVTRPITKC